MLYRSAFYTAHEYFEQASFNAMIRLFQVSVIPWSFHLFWKGLELIITHSCNMSTTFNLAAERQARRPLIQHHEAGRAFIKDTSIRCCSILGDRLNGAGCSSHYVLGMIHNRTLAATSSLQQLIRDWELWSSKQPDYIVGKWTAYLQRIRNLAQQHDMAGSTADIINFENVTRITQSSKLVH